MEGTKAMNDLSALVADMSVCFDQSLAETTLEAAQCWSIPGTPPSQGLENPSCGLSLSAVTKSGFFGKMAGVEIEAELQRHAMLLKGLLRDVAVIQDTVWGMAKERAEVTKVRENQDKTKAEIAALRARVDEAIAKPTKPKHQNSGELHEKVAKQEATRLEAAKQEAARQAAGKEAEGSSKQEAAKRGKFEERLRRLEEVLSMSQFPGLPDLKGDAMPMPSGIPEGLPGGNASQSPGSVVISDTDEVGDTVFATAEAAHITASNVMDQLENFWPSALRSGSPDLMRLSPDLSKHTSGNYPEVPASVEQDLSQLAGETVAEVAQSVIDDIESSVSCNSPTCSRCSSRPRSVGGRLDSSTPRLQDEASDAGARRERNNIPGG